MDLLIAPNTVAYANRDTAPASGTPGWATDGDAANQIPATGDAAYQFNAMQEELMHAIQSDGTALDRDDNTQLAAKLKGRIKGAPILFTSSGTYTPSPGTNAVIVEVQAAGGASAGAPATGASQVSAGAPGSGGSFGAGYFVVGTDFTGSVAVTVGAGGAVGANGAAGGSGGGSSFGSLLTTIGGSGGGISGPGTAPFFAASGPVGAGTGGNIINRAGEPGGISLGMGFNAGGATGGPGGNSPLGTGGAATLAPGVDQARGYGSGGGGTANVGSSSALVGAGGRPGIVRLWEIS